MASKKEKTATEKTSVTEERKLDRLRDEHPFETDSQIENRCGNGREKPGSDGGHGDNQGDNH